jgi:hypothetical protein
MTHADPPLPIGIFARTFPGSSVGPVMQAVAGAGIRHVQFNLSSVGLETVPTIIPSSVEREISSYSDQYHVSIDALSGTCNLSEGWSKPARGSAFPRSRSPPALDTQASSGIRIPTTSPRPPIETCEAQFASCVMRPPAAASPWPSSPKRQTSSRPPIRQRS